MAHPGAAHSAPYPMPMQGPAAPSYSAPSYHQAAIPSTIASTAGAMTAPTGYGYSPPALTPSPSRAPLVIGGFLAVLGLAGAAVAFVILRSDDESVTASTSPDGVAPGSGAQKTQDSSLSGQPTTKAEPATPKVERIKPAGPVAAKPTSAATPAPSGTNLPPGAPCANASQCASSFCVDRVCCDSACNSKCMACSAAKKDAGGNGYCGFISGGGDPDRECGSGKRCDGMGGCMTMTPAQAKALGAP